MKTEIGTPDKETIKKRIHENIQWRESDPWNTHDELNFLVSNKVLLFTERNTPETIILRISWRKRTEFLILIFGTLSIVYIIVDKPSLLNSYWLWSFVAVFVLIAAVYFRFFFRNQVILGISSKGLSLEEAPPLVWSEILYLHFKLIKNNNRTDELQLVVTLKNGEELQTRINDLEWSQKKLGYILYRYMKQRS